MLTCDQLLCSFLQFNAICGTERRAAETNLISYPDPTYGFEMAVGGLGTRRLRDGRLGRKVIVGGWGGVVKLHALHCMHCQVACICLVQIFHA